MRGIMPPIRNPTNKDVMLSVVCLFSFYVRGLCPRRTNMAKRLIDWKVEGSVLVMGKYVDADTPSEMLERFEMSTLFPTEEDEGCGFGMLTEVQQFIFVYGLKQKLADAGSAEKDANAKALIAREKFDLFAEGKIGSPRANGTGAKENKRIAENVRKAVEVVSLEGLMMKKMAFPDTFTDEDQEKLDEFLQMQADFASKQ